MKIWITNGYEIHRIDESEFKFYEDKGFYKGKKLLNKTYTAWNKDLNSNDERVKKNSNSKTKNYWIENSSRFTCSNCEYESNERFPYCPMCGKKMKEI